MKTDAPSTVGRLEISYWSRGSSVSCDVASFSSDLSIC